MFSTYVEVIPLERIKQSAKRCVLHVCGGDPGGRLKQLRPVLCSPRMWRWSPAPPLIWVKPSVFSTYVEVILSQTEFSGLPLGVLHVCGGDPKNMGGVSNEDKCSPRMWRWSWKVGFPFHNTVVFSTYVEVILSDKSPMHLTLSVLHVCGGDPSNVYCFASFSRCSPRMWRWSSFINALFCFSLVFSTYVEVILKPDSGASLETSVLHVCGGDPWLWRVRLPL